jgi:hypothetical protein
MNAAIENEDFDPIQKGELSFDKGEIEKSFEVKLIERE